MQAVCAYQKLMKTKFINEKRNGTPEDVQKKKKGAWNLRVKQEPKKKTHRFESN
jgi:hypothetical protein